ncbi:MAG: M23 family metallopeptidase [Alphaproteobacteria bacterium]|nr:M23 family metallopeptidase [Alphaproteobacteria bacterium]
MNRILSLLTVVLFTQTACDLRPKIIAFPDTVGQFISERYPALLADPDAQPEIYNSAATDYGVYAAPELYGKYDDTQDYVMYASVDDYVLPPQLEVDVGGEILVDNSKKSEKASSDEYLIVPMYGGQTETGDVDVLTVKKPIVGTKTSTRVDVAEVEVQPGDTLYSLSRKYSVPVNDLAVMNKLNPPFALRVGQKIRVPNLEQAMVAKDVVVENKVKQESVQKEQTQSKTEVKTAKAEKKISSDPSKKLPKINARSSSKFSWPVRGKILSAYGAKNNGLFNDGVNIASAKGTSVVAAENGVVAYAGNEIKGMGNLIIVQHESGWMTVYAHLDSMNVKRGTKVNVGQKIGTVGETGKVDSPQLHFEIRKGTKAYDPISYMKK